MDVPVVFYHQDFAKTPGQMFQWPPGKNIGKYKYKLIFCFSPESRGARIRVRRYPMKVLGGRSTPSMTDLRAFVKVNWEGISPN